MGADQELTAPSPDGDPVVAIRNLVRRFGEVVAVNDVSLDIDRGEFISLLGPSGCGKTTLLRIIAGFEHADSGQVAIGGTVMRRIPPEKRPVNMVFQRYALFPHKTVAENIAFGLALKRRPKKEIAETVESLLRLVRLEGFGDRHPTQLSGGQAQRVALARALANDPQVLLLDEPLVGLDLKLRQAMHLELREIQNKVQSTFVYVTHDQEEALTMSDRIVLMNQGAIEQVGTPLQVYRQPATRFVSGFIGQTNLFEGGVVSCDRNGDGGRRIGVEAPQGRLTVYHPDELEVGTRVWVSVRPERMQLAGVGAGRSIGRNQLTGQVDNVVYLGSAVRYIVQVDDGPHVMAQADPEEGTTLFQRGDRVSIEWPETVGTLLCR